MELNVDPNDVNKLVADAVLKSAIGEAVKKAVEKEIINLNLSWDNPLEEVVRRHVSEIVWDVLQKEHAPAIRERITQVLAAKLSQQFIERVCEAAASKYA